MTTLKEKIMGPCPAHLVEEVERFCVAASRASFHHADDSGKEWGLAKPFERECQSIYDSGSDELRKFIESIKGHYLISLKTEPLRDGGS